MNFFMNATPFYISQFYEQFVCARVKCQFGITSKAEIFEVGK